MTSYDLLRHDVRRWAGRPLWLVALDEVQCIKNHETLAARAVKALDARHRLALTGTSIENRLSELWNIFDFLMPGLLGATSASVSAMISPSRWATTTWRRACGVRWAPFILRRLKTDVLADLPGNMVERGRTEPGHGSCPSHRAGARRDGIQGHRP
ncbi:MAG: SNF2-related protein [Olsenella profusa]